MVKPREVAIWKGPRKDIPEGWEEITKEKFPNFTRCKKCGHLYFRRKDPKNTKNRCAKCNRCLDCGRRHDGPCSNDTVLSKIIKHIADDVESKLLTSGAKSYLKEVSKKRLK